MEMQYWKTWDQIYARPENAWLEMKDLNDGDKLCDYATLTLVDKSDVLNF